MHHRTPTFPQSHKRLNSLYEGRENLSTLELKWTNTLKNKSNVNSDTDAKSQNLGNSAQCNKMPAHASLITDDFISLGMLAA